MKGHITFIWRYGWLPVVLCTFGCSRPPDLEIAQRFQDAEQAFAEAQSPDDYAKAAARYEELINDSFVSGAILYNQGNAWMQAGETGRAIAAWRQSQRYRPRDVYLAENLRHAIESCHSSATVEPDNGIPGYLFFWQNWFSYREKYLMATLLVVATSTLLIAGPVLLPRASVGRVLFGVGLFAILAVASAVWDWQRYDRTLHGVVVVDSVEARKGNSESYEAAFTAPLMEGTEFIVLEERSGWLNIQMPKVGSAWIPPRSAVTF
jgi:tetratricopeptide (TPR) repeat protein